jgi:hypothetical protein
MYTVAFLSPALPLPRQGTILRAANSLRVPRRRLHAVAGAGFAPRAVQTSTATTAAAVHHDGADGPPLRYDRDALQAYWTSRSSELNARYLKFASTTAPFFAAVLKNVATRRLGEPEVITALARQARQNMVELGPTFVKIGQTVSCCSAGCCARRDAAYRFRLVLTHLHPLACDQLSLLCFPLDGYSSGHCA